MRTDYEIWKEISGELSRQNEIGAKLNGLIYKGEKLEENADTIAVLAVLKKDIECRKRTLELFEELHSIRNRFNVQQVTHSGLKRQHNI